MSRFKFSGHETFQCRHFWLKKGYDFVNSNGNFASTLALIDLGVGKNMVASINYWLRAFNILNDCDMLTKYGKLLFEDDGLDPYLEDIGTQYLLHFNLIQNSSYASIYKLAFEDFRKTRIDLEFTEEQLYDFVAKYLLRQGVAFSEKTIKSDIKVFLRTYYCGAKSGVKSIEDDLASVLIGLGFISQVEGVMVGGGPLFRINVSEQKALDERLFLFMIMEVFLKQNSISVDQIQTEIADKLLCSREGTEEKLKLLVENGYLVYNQDAGRKEIQLKGSLSRFNLLAGYYGQV